MLKLIHWSEMNINSVKDYIESCEFRNDSCIAIIQLEKSKHKYYEWMDTYEPYFYYLVNDNNPNYILGFGDINNINCKEDYMNDGNISYTIKYCERRKGYGSSLLSLLLKKCEELGMMKVCVACHKDNVGSYKVIKNNNGILEKEFIDIDNGKVLLKFWIKLHPKLSNVLKRAFKKLD